MKEKAKSKKKSRIRLLHQYYNYTGFYSFVWKSVKKAVLPIVLFIGALWAIDHYLLDIEDMLVTITETYAPFEVLSIFFLSGFRPSIQFFAKLKHASPNIFDDSIIL